MFNKIIIAAGFAVLLPLAAQAACTPEAANDKAMDATNTLMAKMSTNSEKATPLMNELGEIMGSGTITEQTCTKLDSLKARASKL